MTIRQPVEPPPSAAILTEDEDGLHVPDLQQRRQREQQRNQDADGHPLRAGQRRQPRVHVERQPAARIPCTQARDPLRHQEAEQASAEAEDEHLRDVGAQHAAIPSAEALEDRDRPDLLLDEHARHARDPIPPSTTMARPIRLRNPSMFARPFVSQFSMK